MVSIFFMILVGHLVFSIFSGSFALYNIFNVSASEAIQKCLDTPDPDGTPSTEQDCNRGYSIVKGIAVTIFILVWLLEICTSFRSHEYRCSALTRTHTHRGLCHYQQLYLATRRGGRGQGQVAQVRCRSGLTGSFQDRPFLFCEIFCCCDQLICVRSDDELDGELDSPSCAWRHGEMVATCITTTLY